MANALYESKLTGSVLFVILHSHFKKLKNNYCLVLGNAVADWYADSFSLAFS